MPGVSTHRVISLSRHLAWQTTSSLVSLSAVLGPSQSVSMSHGRSVSWELAWNIANALGEHATW